MGAITLFKCVMILMGVFFIIGGAIHAMVSFADAADALGGEKFQTAKVAVAWRKSTIATSDDESIAPDEYMKVTVTQKPDKNAIKAAIKSGTEVSGWRLVENMNMTVR
nr:MAG TPA: resistance protein [Caudoviricetes sp.]